MTVREARAFGAKSLPDSPSPQIDADALLKNILGCGKEFLLFKGEANLSEEQEEKFTAWIEARKTGLPVAYITGRKEFFGIEFSVDRSVLIPKPDTEILVENALEIIEEKFAARPSRILSVCDMCAGSGCVGISILRELEKNPAFPSELLPSFTFADISADALEVAKKNAREILGNPARASFIQSNLFDSVRGRFDVIVSNPPYVPHGEAVELLKDGRSEPLLALDGDIGLDGNSSGTDDGLAVIRNLAAQAVKCMSPGGALIIETGEYNATGAQEILGQSGFSKTRTHLDLEGSPRNVSGVMER